MVSISNLREMRLYTRKMDLTFNTSNTGEIYEYTRILLHFSLRITRGRLVSCRVTGQREEVCRSLPVCKGIYFSTFLFCTCALSSRNLLAAYLESTYSQHGLFSIGNIHSDWGSSYAWSSWIFCSRSSSEKSVRNSQAVFRENLHRSL